MPKIKIAHVREQNVDLIIVPLDIGFGDQPPEAQEQTVSELQRVSRAAGLAGDVIPVWDSGAGCMSFIAPQEYHPYFKSINLDVVFRNLNRELSW